MPSPSRPLGLLPILVIALIFVVTRLQPSPLRNRLLVILPIAFASLLLAAALLGLMHRLGVR